MLTVDAIAHQWWWEFQYPTLDVTTSDELHVPSNATVRVRLTSADVIHTFWMPGMSKAVAVGPREPRVLDLRTKAPGQAYGTCEASCGCGAVCMRFHVVASVASDFRRWAVQQRATPQDWGPQGRDDVPPCVSSRG